jgi:membrane-associated PAP2 superfamily phosphatase
LHPGIDLTVAGWFWFPGTGFLLADNQVLVAIRDFHRESTSVIVKLATLVVILFGLGLNLRVLIKPHAALFVVATYGLGSGLLVHALKIATGRARPFNILEFGGLQDFTPAWKVSSACLANCSFISGEAATAVAMLSLAMIFVGRWRRTVFMVCVPLAIVFSLNRMAFGAHFLSDIVLSWLLTGLAMVTLWQVVSRHADAVDRAMEGWIPVAFRQLVAWLKPRKPWLDAALRTRLRPA